MLPARAGYLSFQASCESLMGDPHSGISKKLSPVFRDQSFNKSWWFSICYSMSHSLRRGEIGVREDPPRPQGRTHQLGLREHVPEPNPAPESWLPQGQRVTTVAEQTVEETARNPGLGGRKVTGVRTVCEPGSTPQAHAPLSHWTELTRYKFKKVSRQCLYSLMNF